jgi:hypothetical protein
MGKRGGIDKERSECLGSQYEYTLRLGIEVTDIYILQLELHYLVGANTTNSSPFIVKNKL